jgi:hypothetical protein
MQENSSLLTMRVEEVIFCLVVVTKERALPAMRSPLSAKEHYRLKFPGGNGGGVLVFHYDVAEGICMEVAPLREVPVIAVLFSVFDV